MPSVPQKKTLQQWLHCPKTGSELFAHARWLHLLQNNPRLTNTESNLHGPRKKKAVERSDPSTSRTETPLIIRHMWKHVLADNSAIGSGKTDKKQHTTHQLWGPCCVFLQALWVYISSHSGNSTGETEQNLERTKQEK